MTLILHWYKILEPTDQKDTLKPKVGGALQNAKPTKPLIYPLASDILILLCQRYKAGRKLQLTPRTLSTFWCFKLMSPIGQVGWICRAWKVLDYFVTDMQLNVTTDPFALISFSYSYILPFPFPNNALGCGDMRHYYVECPDGSVQLV